MQLSENMPTGTILYNGYIVINCHKDCYLISTNSPCLPWCVHSKGATHYFGDFFQAVDNFKEEVEQ